MSPTDLDGLLDESDDDSELVRKLRGALKDNSKGRKGLESDLEAAQRELGELRRSSLFDEAGISKDGQGALLRKALAGSEDLTLETIRSEAETYGISATPAPEAGPGEQAAHAAVAAATSAEAAPPQSFEADFAAAETPEEIIRLAEAQGVPRL